VRTLSRIADELAKTAPVLVSFLHIFNRLASGEDMPQRRPLRRLRRLRRKLSTTALTWMFVGIWSGVTAGMLAFALVMTYTGQTSGAGAQSTCTASSLLLPGCSGGQPKVPGR
jgi:sterol desaturase/sphingolipid hydroxylase (fatty acid hydroxylase superfamily)